MVGDMELGSDGGAFLVITDNKGQCSRQFPGLVSSKSHRGFVCRQAICGRSALEPAGQIPGTSQQVTVKTGQLPLQAAEE
jgi:hypothetical protein